MEKSDLQNILADLTNINLFVLGLSISIFTLIYSFLVTKKGDLSQIKDKMKLDKENPYDIQKEYFLLTYIKHFSELNRKLLYLIYASLALFVLMFLYNRFFIDYFPYIQKILFLTFSCLTVILVICFVFAFVVMIRKYKKETAV